MDQPASATDAAPETPTPPQVVAAPARPGLLRLDSPGWDLAGFVLGLALAWSLSWSTRDLVWSLWLSSLVIGYLSLLIGIVGMVSRSWTSAGAIAGGLVLGCFLVLFFTIHFGVFHLGHSVFLSVFFPLIEMPKDSTPVSPELYLLVATSYWPWLAAAAIAERSVLVQSWGTAPPAGEPVHPLTGFNPIRPYLNVVRMHLLIFFFAATYALKLDGFWIFAVVFAVYFFPWRLLRRRQAEAAA